MLFFTKFDFFIDNGITEPINDTISPSTSHSRQYSSIGHRNNFNRKDGTRPVVDKNELNSRLNKPEILPKVVSICGKIYVENDETDRIVMSFLKELPPK